MNKMLAVVFDNELEAESGMQALGKLHAQGDTLAEMRKQEADAKCELLSNQWDTAKGDVKARIDHRIKGVKRDQQARDAKLSQAWALTKEALAV